MYTFLFGVLIGVVGQGVSSLGLVLMKRSHASTKAWYKNYRWYLSFLVFISGNISQAVALSLAPQSVIAALPVLVLVYNSIWAPLLLHEKLHRRDLFGITVTVIGVLLVVIFGPKTEGNYNNHQLISFFRDEMFLIYAGIIFLLAIGSFTFNTIMQKKAAIKYPSWTIHGYNCFEKLAPMSASISPAIFSSFNAIFSKIIGELVMTTVKGSNQFKSWQPYVFILCLAFTNTTQIILLQKALKNFQALQIIPMYESLLTIFAVIGGGIYFEEFLSFNNHPIYYPIIFGSGLILSIAGVMILPQRGAHSEKTRYSSDESEADVEEKELLSGNNSDNESKTSPRVKFYSSTDMDADNYDIEAPLVVKSSTSPLYIPSK